MRNIADKLDLNEETVRNYFGGRNFDKAKVLEFILNRDQTVVLLHLTTHYSRAGQEND